MKIKKSVGSWIFDIFNTLLMLILSVIMLYPVLNVLAKAVSSTTAVTSGIVTIYPIGFTLESIKYMLGHDYVLTAYGNTLFYCVFGTLASITFTSMFAYPLSIENFVYKKSLTIYITITMFFGGGLIPYYILLRGMDLIDSRWVLVIPGAVGAWNTVIYRTFFQGISPSLRESALIDGANDMTILTRIYLPLSKPLLATMALFCFVGKWNDFFYPMILLNSADKQPMQTILRALLIEGQMSAEEVANMSDKLNVTPESTKCAAIVITIGPVLVMYPFLQKYFAKGVMIGSIKG